MRAQTSDISQTRKMKIDSAVAVSKDMGKRVLFRHHSKGLPDPQAVIVLMMFFHIRGCCRGENRSKPT
jgi:hypothetical protein